MAAERDGAVATAGSGRRKKTARSEVLGVYRLQHGKYRSRIWDPSRRAMKHLGVFATAEDAARAYDAAAVGLHGAATALTYFRQNAAAATADGGDGDAPLRHVSCVDMDAKADGGDGDAPLRHVSCVDMDEKADGDGGDAPLRHVSYVDMDAKAYGDGGDAPLRNVSCVDMDAKADGDSVALLRHVSCVGEDVGAVQSCRGRDAVESTKERKAPLRPVARTVFRLVSKKPTGKCVARIRCPKVGARRYLGGFNTAEEAARAYIASAVKLPGAVGLKKSPAAGEVSFKGQAGGKAAAAAKSRSRSSSMPAFHGVRIWDPAQRAKLFLGAFDAAEEADGAFDAEAVKLRGAMAKTNLKRQPTVRKKAATRTDAGTKFRGVHRKPSGKYAAQNRHAGGNSRCLGPFDTAEDAVRAYDAAAVKLHGVKAITNFNNTPMAAAVDDGEESPMDLNDVPEMRGVRAKTNLNKPPLVAGSADDGEESRMDLAHSNFPELPALGLFSGSITADAQLDDMFADLPPLDLQQVGELLKDMDFANMMA
ncbi:hypothetical protein ZWY2020_014239 [Hordeum vulgare]|nr:hypothetical protein ZWY2020_014239 [Hordeum vulgare]